MICKECTCDRKASDFLGKDNCYKCQYKKKMQKIDSHHIRLCKVCGGRFLKGSRWVYCSLECQTKAEKSQKREYWTNHVD